MAGLPDEFVLIAPDGGRYKLSNGMALYANLFHGAQPFLGNGPIAQVSSNPYNPSILGITNLSTYVWDANIPGRGIVKITNGRTVRLEHGLTLSIGPLQFRIESYMMPSRIQVQSGWKIRITNGVNAGCEYALNQGLHHLGNGPPSDILIPDPHIALQQAELNVYSDRVMIRNLVYGGVISTSKGMFQTMVLSPGDGFSINGVSFVALNPALVQARMTPSPWQNIKWDYRNLGGLMAGMALIFIVLYIMTGVTNIIPALLLIVSSVVPVTAIAYLVEKYDKTGISFRTLVGSFLLGGTVGIVAAIFFEWTANVVLGGVIPLPILAGAVEEPAKLFATFWRWKHPIYDRPMDGLIIGSVCGFGFAVFETAGYGLTSLLHGGVESLLMTLALRSFLSPFGHGLWAGIVGAAFWECGRDIKLAIKDPRFQRALLIAVGLHTLWDTSNSFSNIPLLVFIPIIASAVLSVRIYKRLLDRQGYSL